MRKTIGILMVLMLLTTSITIVSGVENKDTHSSGPTETLTFRFFVFFDLNGDLMHDGSEPIVDRGLVSLYQYDEDTGKKNYYDTGYTDSMGFCSIDAESGYIYSVEVKEQIGFKVYKGGYETLVSSGWYDIPCRYSHDTWWQPLILLCRPLSNYLLYCWTSDFLCFWYYIAEHIYCRWCEPIYGGWWNLVDHPEQPLDI